MKEQYLGSGVLLRPANIADLPDLLRVCLETGDSGKDATHLHNLHELVGEIYVAPYVLHEPDFAYALTAKKEVVGYLLGVLDTAKFESKLSTEYWPATNIKYQEVNRDVTLADLDLIAELAKQGFSDPDLIAKYPSHLHIDIVESHQGCGLGKAMISHLLNELKNAGSSGVHLHMSATNERARHFYQKFGFTDITSDPNEIIMGLLY